MNFWDFVISFALGACWGLVSYYLYSRDIDPANVYEPQPGRLTDVDDRGYKE